MGVARRVVGSRSAAVAPRPVKGSPRRDRFKSFCPFLACPSGFVGSFDLELPQYFHASLDPPKGPSRGLTETGRLHRRQARTVPGVAQGCGRAWMLKCDGRRSALASPRPSLKTPEWGAARLVVRPRALCRASSPTGDGCLNNAADILSKYEVGVGRRRASST